MLVEFQIILDQQIKCGRCDGVAIKLSNPSKLLINDGALAADIKKFLKGTIVEFEEVALPGSCDVSYRYTLSYDDVFLLDPLDPIEDCDVERVCCADCQFDYIDEFAFLHILSSPSQGVVRLTRPDATFDDVEVTVFTNLPITGDGSAATPVDLLISADANNILTLGSDSGLFASPHTVETITTLVDNGDNSFTYTSEDVTITIFNAAHTLSEPVPNTVRLTRPDGTFDEVIISGDPDVVTTLVDNGDNSFTYTSEDATVTNFDAAHTLSEPVANTVRLTRPDGTFDDVAVSFSETITTLVDNGNNTFTYTSENATITNFDVEHDLTKVNAKTFRLTKPDGTFDDAATTDTSQSGALGFTDTVSPYVFNAGAPYTSDIAGPLVINAPAGRQVEVDVEFAFRPDYIFDSQTGAAESVNITQILEYRLDGGAWTPITTQQLRYELTAGNLIQRPELHNERLFFTVPAGGNITLESRFRIVSTNTNTNSQLNALNGSINYFGSTV